MGGEMMNKMMNNFLSLILSGKFIEASVLEKNLDCECVYNSIMDAAYRTESNLFYIYYLNKLIINENAEDNYRASLIMSQVLNFEDGAYDLAAYHAKRAILLDNSNINYKEYYLYFYKHPDLSLEISYDEFRVYAEQILKIDPDNISARDLLRDTI